MSYDVMIKFGDGTRYEHNITFNLLTIFKITLDADGLRALDGKPTPMVYDILEDALEILKHNWDDLRQYEPENRWGTLRNVYELYTGMQLAILENDYIGTVEVYS